VKRRKRSGSGGCTECSFCSGLKVKIFTPNNLFHLKTLSRITQWGLYCYLFALEVLSQFLPFGVMSGEFINLLLVLQRDVNVRILWIDMIQVSRPSVDEIGKHK
jgi:hypothetical protein